MKNLVALAPILDAISCPALSNSPDPPQLDSFISDSTHHLPHDIYFFYSCLSMNLVEMCLNVISLIMVSGFAVVSHS